MTNLSSRIGMVINLIKTGEGAALKRPEKKLP
jgi:hypothetical protein